MTKICTKCNLEKDITEFHKRKYPSGNYGIMSRCKQCTHLRINNARLRLIEKHKLNGTIIEYNKRRCQDASNTAKRLNDAVITGYGGKCACCGETERAFLTLDHVNGGGTKHILKYSKIHYRDALKRNFPKDYQVLCFNCNCAKRSMGVCPHQLDKKM